MNRSCIFSCHIFSFISAECSSASDCESNVRCEGCICQKFPTYSSDVGRIMEASLDKSQTSQRNMCFARRGAYHDRHLSTRNCDYRAVEDPHDVRVILHNFQPGEYYYFYYQALSYPDKFTITLGACEPLTEYDGPGVLGTFTTKQLSGRYGCPGTQDFKPGNPAGSTPCCDPRKNNLLPSGAPRCDPRNACGVTGTYIRFRVPRSYSRLYVTAFGPCQDTNWGWRLCSESNRQNCGAR